jgi:hypothetical protein
MSRLRVKTGQIQMIGPEAGPLLQLIAEALPANRGNNQQDQR